ncbi:MAG: hypothetical protein SGPRY_013673 [Prymnesium sp.]
MGKLSHGISFAASRTSSECHNSAIAQRDVLTYTVSKEAAPLEEAKSRRWIEPDGITMKAESFFRKDPSRPWATLKRTWTRAKS